jgi:hypothetical protein
MEELTYQKTNLIEAPHLYKKDGKYFLMCAEGVLEVIILVIFKSDSPKDHLFLRAS